MILLECIPKSCGLSIPQAKVLSRLKNEPMRVNKNIASALLRLGYIEPAACGLFEITRAGVIAAPTVESRELSLDFYLAYENEIDGLVKKLFGVPCIWKASFFSCFACGRQGYEISRYDKDHFCRECSQNISHAHEAVKEKRKRHERC